MWITAGAIPEGDGQSQLAQFRFGGVYTVTDPSTGRSFPYYRCGFRLLNVGFFVHGHVSGDIPFEITPNETLRRVMLPLSPAQHPKVWWPPVGTIDEIGGLIDLVETEIENIPTFG